MGRSSVDDNCLKQSINVGVDIAAIPVIIDGYHDEEAISSLRVPPIFNSALLKIGGTLRLLIASSSWYPSMMTGIAAISTPTLIDCFRQLSSTLDRPIDMPREQRLKQ